ncbi:F-box domain-containing protein [Colletotrichum sojae]|uniref:F-box domain-containing protein n=1 Tax=Colletotrichum sojae TaxID=2175907 RepID=A0A8H6J5E2_9PEZI|nr:F-box domain-containing protein [Colletotrichum sojae]
MQLEVLKNCLPVDLVCLSLTCRYLRDLALPMIPEKPQFDSYDQTNGPIPCDCAGNGVDFLVEYSSYHHKYKRHVFSSWGLPYRCNDCKARTDYPEAHQACPKRWCAHCECITCPLHKRLREWMGKNRRYCDDIRCRKFTTRHKKDKGRCKSPLMFYCDGSGNRSQLMLEIQGLHGASRRKPAYYWLQREGLL